MLIFILFLPAAHAGGSALTQPQPQVKTSTEAVHLFYGPKLPQYYQELSPLELEIGQLLMPTADISGVGRLQKAVARGEIGGIVLQWGRFDSKNTFGVTYALQRLAAKSPLHEPLIIAADYEGGPVFAPETLGLPDLPTNMMIGAANNGDNCGLLFYLAGQELKKAGINMNFSPVLDINTEPTNPIIGVRSFGDDPERAATLGTAVINGLKAAGIAPVAKHFPGHGAAKADSHLELPRIDISTEALKAHLLPFARAVDAKVTGIMTAHVLYPALDPVNPATFSTAAVAGLLRGELGFKGVILSDSLDMKGASGKTSVETAAVAALKAGVNLLIIGNGNPARVRAAIVDAVNRGEISQAALDYDAQMVAKLKAKYAKPSPKPHSLEFSETYRDVSKAIADEGVTLVRDTQNLAPLTPSTASVCAVFFVPPRFAGDMVRFSAPLMRGGAEVQVYNSRVEPGAKDAKRAMECAALADVTVVGSFQWAAKPADAQVNLIKKLLSSGKKTALLSLMSPYDITLYPEAKTVIALYGITRFSSEAAGALLGGEIKPLGKLPVTVTQ